MPDLYFDVDAALTEVPVNLLPLIDDTDFKTREVAIAYDAAGMDLVWNFVTSAGVFTQTAVTPTTAGNYDWTHQGDGIYTIEIPASGGASINNDTEGFGWFSGVATGVLPWRGPVIGFRAAALNDALCDGGDNLDVNVTQFGGTNATATGGRPEVNTSHAAGTAWGSGAITAAAIADGAIDAATLAADVWARLGIVAYGTAQAATGTTLQLAAASAFADDELNGAIVVITGGTGVGQARLITDYASATDTATVDTWTTTPSGTITYVVFATAPASATSLPAVNVVQISGDAGAADNLEAACDGTGYNVGGGSVVAASVTGAVGSVTGAVGSVTGAVGSVTGNVGGNVTGSVGSVAADGITAASLAADVTTELQSGLATASALSTVAGYLDTEIAAILADTNELQTDWADGGRLDLILDAASAPSAATVADAVWDEALSGHVTAGSAGLALATASSGGVDPSVLADAIWDEALSGHATAGTTGKKLTDLANADLSGVATAAALTTVAGYVDTEVAAIKAKTDLIPAAPAAVGDLAGLATAANLATVDTVVDGLATTLGVAGAGLTALGDTRLANLDATVSSRLAPAGTLATVTNLTNAPTAGDLTATMKTSVTTAATAATPTAAAVTGAVGSVTAGVTLAADALSASALSAAAIDEILDETIGDGTITMREALRILVAGMAGKVSGAATTTVTIRNVADSANVIVATVDADGNRSATTVTP